MTFIKNVLVAADQLANTLLQGSASETLSSRAWRMSVKQQPYWGWTQKAIDAIFFWQPNHCQTSFNNERSNAQTPPELR